MKSVIVYIPTSAKHPTIERIALEIADGFQMLGYDVARIDLSNNKEIQLAYDYMQAGKIDFSVGINASVAFIRNIDGNSIYKNLDVPYVSIMLDAPYNLSIGNIDFECKKHLLCLLDRSHPELIKPLFPKKKFWGTVFLPLGGIPGGIEDEIFETDRPLDVLYSGGIYKNGDPGRVWRNDPKKKCCSKILDDVADYLIENPVSVAEGFDYILKQRGLYGEEFSKALLPFYFDVFLYIKAIRRVKGLEFLAKNDISIDVFGPGWETVPSLKKYYGNTIRLHGETSYQEALDLMSKSKVVFQDQAEFNNGAHDRVFSAMLSGAVMVSEYSTYLAEEFEEGKDIFFYDWKNGLSQVNVIKELISDESKRLSVAISAYSKASKKHRWVNRAESIAEAVDLLRLDNSF